MDNSVASQPNKGRVRILDVLRGFSLLSMIAFHTTYDLLVFFGWDIPWYYEWPGRLWQQSICWVFILVSGASLHYGRNTLRRGLTVLICAMGLTLVTVVATPGQAIWFGVLHFMGSAMLLVGLLRPVLQRLPEVVGLVASFALFLLLYGLPRGYLGIGPLQLVQLPYGLYAFDWLAPLGFPGPGFVSADYFPLLPWLLLYLTGWFGWALLKDRAPRGVPGKNPLEWMGRHSLLIYMLHQPVIFGVLWLLGWAGLV